MTKRRPGDLFPQKLSPVPRICIFGSLSQMSHWPDIAPAAQLGHGLTISPSRNVQTVIKLTEHDRLWSA